jgi:hypothetical protein
MHTLLLMALVLTGCGPKKPAANNGTAGDGSALTEATKVPNDDASRAFAQKLLTHDIIDFQPADNNTDAKFIYKTVHFKADNSWNAVAKMYAQGEEVDCAERGTWEMDPADNATTAAVNLSVNYTNCPGRPQENILRLKMSYDGGSWKISFR